MLLPVLREGGSRQPGHLPGAGAAAGTRATGGGPAWYAAVHLCAWEGPTEMLLEICGGGVGELLFRLLGPENGHPTETSATPRIPKLSDFFLGTSHVVFLFKKIGVQKKIVTFLCAVRWQKVAKF